MCHEDGLDATKRILLLIRRLEMHAYSVVGVVEKREAVVEEQLRVV